MISFELFSDAEVGQVLHKLAMLSDFRRAFPTMASPRFLKSIREGRMILENSEVKGMLLDICPSGEFRSYGVTETLLMIFPEYQRQGVGTCAISLLAEEEHTRFFVSATSNNESSAFFKKHSGLYLTHENDRYRVYSIAIDGTPVTN
jgi:hypothetical protein